MATTSSDIRRWLEEGKKTGATHVIVATDTYDWSDYPIFVKPYEDARERSEALGEMQRLTEVYDLSKDFEAQLCAPRAMNF
jgi:hypothetical protein